MLPEAPVPARRKQTLLVAGAVTSCGIAVGALLTGPPLHVPGVLALACVVLGNAAVVYVAWPDADGSLIRVRARRKSGRRKSGRRNGSPAGRGRYGTPGTAPAPAGRPVLRAVARLMPPAAGAAGWRRPTACCLSWPPGSAAGRSAVTCGLLPR